jgi:hypothetical protein
LTTDLILSFVQAIELFQICWTIEVMFKECIQYLQLECSQNTDFNVQIADTTIALVKYCSNLKNTAKAEENYLEALKNDALFYPAKINLALINYK